ncbi:MAG: Ig-like domain-containing protein [Dysgonamonadaceae bacterium]|jgi:hypothetical protein|nr:Ig-like domain-containing protein [Dysgonamonadaceae bacterium]
MKKHRYIDLLASLVVVGWLIVSCKGKEDTAVSITLHTHTLSLLTGESETLTALVTPSNQILHWTSSNPDIATVDDGVVHATDAGKAIIQVKAGNGAAFCDITVTAPPVEVTAVKLGTSVLSLPVGGKETLTATIEPPNATNQNVRWHSSNETVATVDEGVVTALEKGTSVITATSLSHPEKKAALTLTVVDPAITPMQPENGAQVNIACGRPVAFRWVSSKAPSAGFILSISVNDNMSSPWEIPVDETSTTLSADSIVTHMDGSIPDHTTGKLYWSVRTATPSDNIQASPTMELNVSREIIALVPLSFSQGSGGGVTLITEAGYVTLKTTASDPWIRTTTLGTVLPDGANRVLTFEYKSNGVEEGCAFYWCVNGGAQGWKVSTAPLPYATDWRRFEFDLAAPILLYEFGVSDLGGQPPANHFIRFDPSGDAGFEISIRNFQIQVFD